jgi:hypothetical protein
MTSALVLRYGLNASWSLDLGALQQYALPALLAQGDSSSFTCNPAWREGVPSACGGLANVALSSEAIEIHYPGEGGWRWWGGWSWLAED